MDRKLLKSLAILYILVGFLLVLLAPLTILLGLLLLSLALLRPVNGMLKTFWRRDSLHGTSDLLKNLKKEIGTVKFVSANRIKELITPETVRTMLSDSNDQEMISAIVHKAPRLFAGLVLINKHLYIQKLLDLNADDDLFKRLKPKGPIRTSNGLINLSGLSPESFQKDLYNIHGKLPFPFESEGIPAYASTYVLPYKSTKSIRSGGFGSVFKVEVAGGHLKGCVSDKVVAEKRIRIDEHDRQSSRDVVLREQDTLRARKHPNILPLLAVFFATEKKAGVSLHLLMPYAIGGDLEKWMTSDSIPLYPPFLEEHSSLIGFIYDSILTIISALAYVHSDRDGMWTGHYDVKPANILLFAEKGQWLWKLSDFGHSQLKPVDTEPVTDRHLGTLDYQPPEYWTSPRRGEIYLSFDVYAMGCVIIQLATLIVYPDWGNNQVNVFHNRRADPGVEQGRSKNHPFGTNKDVIDDWIGQLRQVHGSPVLERLLDTAEEMMIEDPTQRLLAFDAAMDIWALFNQDKSSTEFEMQCEKLSEGQGPGPKFGIAYNPHERERKFATLHGEHRTNKRTKCLDAIGWRRPTTNRLDDSSRVSARTVKSFTTLPTTYQASNLCGREKQLDQVELHLEKAYTVGIFGIGGIGKSHVAWRYAYDLSKKEWNSGNTMHVFWVQAKDMLTLEMSYAAIGREVGIAGEDGEVSLQSVNEWLQNRDHWPWLIVFDGVDKDFAKLSNYCPWHAQKVLITTKDRAIALKYCEPDHILVLDGLEAEDGLVLFKQRVPTMSSADEKPAKSLASKLHLPLYIELMSAHINLKAGGRTSIASMNGRFNSKRALAAYTAERQTSRPGLDLATPRDFTFFDIVFEPLKKKRYRQFQGAFRLMCLFPKDAIDMRMIRERIIGGNEEDILACLTNLCFIKKSSRDEYSIHEIVQTAFLEWIAQKDGMQDLWSGRLRVLKMLWAEYNDAKRIQLADDYTGIETPLHLLKLRSRIHVEGFLEFLRNYPEIQGSFTLPSARAVVSSARMLRDENEFEDAIFLLDRLINREIIEHEPGLLEPGEFEQKAQKVKLQSFLELIETYRASASGGKSFDVLEKALKVADDAISEAEVANDLHMKRRLRATRIDVLCDSRDYLKARQSIDELEAEAIVKPIEARKQQLRVLGLRATLYCVEGKDKRDIEQLRKSQALWQEHLKLISESPYNRQERKEREGEVKQEYINTCLAILTVLTENTFGADVDVEAIAADAQREAWDLSNEIFENTKSMYGEEAPKLSEHRRIQDAKLILGAVMLRYGLWKRENQFAQIKDSVELFQGILNAYRKKLGLTDTDKDVRRCAYYLREGLHWLVQHDECGVEYISTKEKLEREYNMAPWVD